MGEAPDLLSPFVAAFGPYVGTAACIFALGFLAICVASALSSGGMRSLYCRGRFLSPNEKCFFSALRRALGDGYLVCPQVRLAEIVDVNPRVGGAKRQAALYRVAGKSIDFVVCSSLTFELLAAIEVDDRSHFRQERRERDAFVNSLFGEIGLPLVRVAAKRDYSAAVLREALEAAGIFSRIGASL
ncbi:DUF2726 domain-containing protein [Methylocella tundrae]|nr:DUF2726 domain-containing protein [Methylocella tundrae]